MGRTYDALGSEPHNHVPGGLKTRTDEVPRLEPVSVAGPESEASSSHESESNPDLLSRLVKYAWLNIETS